MQVGQCCNKHVVVAAVDTDIEQAAKMMRTYHVGALVVVERLDDGVDRPVGIVTDRDLVIEVLANGGPFDEVRLGDVMSDGISTAGNDDDLWDTLERMRNLGIRRMPVVNEDGGLDGIITMDDILAMMAQGLNDMTEIIRAEVAEEARERP